MTKDELIEALAAIEHTRWADWQRWVHSRGYRLEHESYLECRREDGEPVYAELLDGSLVINRSHLMGWERQIVTPYAELSEREKRSDREEVMRSWPVIVAFVAEWLDGVGSRQAELLAARWRADMSAPALVEGIAEIEAEARTWPSPDAPEIVR